MTTTAAAVRRRHCFPVGPSAVSRMRPVRAARRVGIVWRGWVASAVGGCRYSGSGDSYFWGGPSL